MRIVAIVTGMLALAPLASAAPSFDCSKASNAAERLICDDTDLQWFDRHLARLYKLARDQAGAAGELLVNDQRAFIGRRDTCVVNRDYYDFNYACVFEAYETRLDELKSHVDVNEAYAKHKSQDGTLWIVRFGFDASIKISTLSNYHFCSFEADSAELGGKGVIRWRGQGANACRIDIVPEGDDLRVQTKNCERYCGARATMDGLYGHAP